MLITIPTTYFAKKVILTEYRVPPRVQQNYALPLGDGDDLFDVLRYNRILKTQKPQNLPASLAISLPPNLVKLIGSDYQALGLRLDRFAKKDIMCRTVMAQVKSGVSQTVALEQFYEEYGLDEWDFSRESATKRVQRFFDEKKSSNFRTNQDCLVLKKSEILSKNALPTCVYSNTDLEAFAKRYEKTYPSLFRGSQNRPVKLRHQQLRVWIHLHIGQFTPQYCAQHFNIVRSQVYYNATAFQNLAKKRHKSLPTPSFHTL
jgi:hypothetical protein